MSWALGRSHYIRKTRSRNPAYPRIILLHDCSAECGLYTYVGGGGGAASTLKISEAEMSVRAIRRTLVTHDDEDDPSSAAVTNFYIIIMNGGVSYFAVVVAFALLAENCGVQCKKRRKTCEFLHENERMVFGVLQFGSMYSETNLI